MNKKTGEVVWEDNTPFDKILHGQWSSPAMGIVDGQVQIYFPGGDGWLYAMDAKTGEHIWKFDLNPKDAKWELGGRGTRNNMIATPVFYENSVVLGMGQDPEHGDGVGHIYRIDATKKGDVSPVTPENKPNPNSAQIWHWGGVDTDGSLTGEKDNECFRRTLSTVAIHDGLVYAPDLSGRIHCLDFATGKRYWEADILAAIWGSPMVADGKMFLGDEDGILSIFAAGKELKKIKRDRIPVLDLQHAHHRQRRDVRLRPLAVVRDRDAVAGPRERKIIIVDVELIRALLSVREGSRGTPTDRGAGFSEPRTA